MGARITRILVGTCVLMLTSLSQAGDDDSSIDLQIAKYSAILATNQLSQNSDDRKALLLLKMSGVLNTKDENYLFTNALLKREMKPDKIETRVTLDKLLAVMHKRMVWLYKNKYPKNKEVAKLILLYAKVLEEHMPKDRDLLVIQQALSIDGVTADLNDLVAQPMDVDSLFDAAEDALARPSRTITAPPPADDEKQAIPVKFETSFGDEMAGLKKYFKVETGVVEKSYDANEGNKKKKKKIRHYVEFPSRGGDLETKFMFVGDFKATFVVAFSKMRVKLKYRTMDIGSPKHSDEAVKFTIERRDRDIIAYFGKRDENPVEKIGLTRGDEDAYVLEIQFRRSRNPVRLYNMEMKGSALPVE